MRAIRGSEITLIFQEPMISLSPVHSMGNQIGEATCWHRDASRKKARMQALRLLDRVGMPNPAMNIPTSCPMAGGNAS